MGNEWELASRFSGIDFIELKIKKKKTETIFAQTKRQPTTPAWKTATHMKLGDLNAQKAKLSVKKFFGEGVQKPFSSLVNHLIVHPHSSSSPVCITTNAVFLN